MKCSEQSAADKSNLRTFNSFFVKLQYKRSVGHFLMHKITVLDKLFSSVSLLVTSMPGHDTLLAKEVVAEWAGAVEPWFGDMYHQQQIYLITTE